MEKKTGSIEEKRAMLRLEGLLKFLDTPSQERGTISACDLPTLEDAKEIITYCNSDAKRRVFLWDWDGSYYPGFWIDFLTNTNEGERLNKESHKQCQEVKQVFALLAQADRLLDESQEAESKRQEVLIINARSEVEELLGLPTEPAQAAAVPVLPAELATEAAMVYWRNAQAKGWVNADYSFNGTRPQMAYFAEIMAEKLGLKYKWKPFIKLWEYRYLAQDRERSRDLIGKVEEEKEIERIFE